MFSWSLTAKLYEDKRKCSFVVSTANCLAPWVARTSVCSWLLSMFSHHFLWSLPWNLSGLVNVQTPASLSIPVTTQSSMKAWWGCRRHFMERRGIKQEDYKILNGPTCDFSLSVQIQPIITVIYPYLWQSHHYKTLHACHDSWAVMSCVTFCGHPDDLELKCWSKSITIWFESEWVEILSKIVRSKQFVQCTPGQVKALYSVYYNTFRIYEYIGKRMKCVYKKKPHIYDSETQSGVFIPLMIVFPNILLRNMPLQILKFAGKFYNSKTSYWVHPYFQNNVMWTALKHAI